MPAETIRLHLSAREGDVPTGPVDCDALVMTSPAGETWIGRRGKRGPPRLAGRIFVLAIDLNGSLAGPDTSGILSCSVAPPTDRRVLLRVDRILLKAGSITPRHRHLGPGIRLLTAGALDAMVGCRRFPVRPGEAWLEAVDDDIIGRVVGEEPASFIRFVLLPPELDGGRSSFVAVAPRKGDPEDAPFEREQTILAEALLDL
ncbi:MAG TPA: hypothetical protein VFZ01_17270 [Geminicoccaceae bacterium]